MSVVDASYEHPLEVEEAASAALAGGIMNMGYQCGMLWGAALAGGAQAYRLLGPGPQAETGAIAAAQEIVEAFQARNKNEINCLEITHLNLKGKTDALPIIKFIVKGGPIYCFSMSAGYAPEAARAINDALARDHSEAPSPPVSCAAMLAQKMGASEMHTTMAAGLAGGIGLSGGACGALGAAIWIIGINGRKEGLDPKVIEARISEAMDRFLNSSDFEFECARIVGRKFADASDHAGHLQDGGCAPILEALAEHAPAS